MKTTNSIETSITFYKSTRHRIQEELNLHYRCCENLTSRKYYMVADVEFRIFNGKGFWTEHIAGHTE